MDYQTALELLKAPQSWKQAGRALADLGLPGALLPLIQAYELRFEGSRQPLLQAMQALNPEKEIPRLFQGTANLEERRLLVHLMELFPSDGYIALLAESAASEDPGLRRQTGRTLFCQRQTDAWERVMCNLLASPDAYLRAWVIEGLGMCRRGSTRKALKEHLDREPDLTLQQKIRAMLEG